MSRIALPELEGITRFLEARALTNSPRTIDDWCEARDIDTRDVLRYGLAMSRSCLATIAAGERQAGEPATTTEVESAISTAIVTALQVGVDVERRRRDGTELPL